MNRAFVFKLIIIIWSTAKMTLMLFPFFYLAISIKQGKLKYGYDFFVIDYRWALMISLGIAMALVVWTAMEFANLEFKDLRQYLKSRQKHYYKFRDREGHPETEDALRTFAESKRRWSFREAGQNEWKLIRHNPFFIRDIVRVKAVPGGLEIESAPKGFAWLVDAARNYRHVLALGDYLKEVGR